MLAPRNWEYYWNKQKERKLSMSGWDMEKGYFHKPRRSGKYASRGKKQFACKAFGRHPNANFLKG